MLRKDEIEAIYCGLKKVAIRLFVIFRENKPKLNIMLLKKIILLSLLNLSFNAYSQDLAHRLQAHFTLDSTLNDISGNSEHLTTLNSIVYSSVMSQDYAFDFDGATRLNSIGSFDNSTYTSTSISLWFKTSTLTSSEDQTLLQGAYMGFGVHILPSTGQIGVFFDPAAASSLRSANSVVDGQWHNVIGINDGITTSLFLDGVLIGTKTESLNVGNGGINNKLYFGKTNLSSRPYTGLLNDVRIYDRVLLDCEIEILSHPSFQIQSLNTNLQAELREYRPKADGNLETSALGLMFRVAIQ